MILGNDVSSWQGQIDWDVYKNNSNFVIIRSSYGDGYTDTQFIRNQSEARRVGLPLGYYHYSYAQYNTATAEANWFLKTLGQLREGEILVLDFEEHYPGDVVGWCKSFLDECYSKTGVKPLIYLNQSQTQAYNWKPVIDGGYGLLVAAYTYDPNNNNFQKGTWQIVSAQQWTNKQAVPGIVGPVDGDVFFGDAKAFKAYGYHEIVAPEIGLNNNQRDPRWINTKLGFSESTIGMYGCTVSAIGDVLGLTPDVVNEKMKAVNGFSNGNLVIWAKIEEAFPGVKINRVWTYTDADNQIVKDNVPNVIVEVPATAIGGSGKHWINFIGNQKCKDPWTGTVRPTSDFPGASGYCIITGKWTGATPAPIPTPPPPSAPPASPAPTTPPVPPTTPSTPVDPCANYKVKEKQIKDALYGKGFWWEKLNKIKILLLK